MPVDKEDRRSQRTRRLLEHALVELMWEKRYDQITVQDIIDRADVGRSTFYAHYLDKEDLLMRSIERMLDGLSQHIELDQASDHNFIPVLGLFRHVQASQRLYEALVWGRGVERLDKRVHILLRTRIEQDLRTYQGESHTSDVPLPIVADYLAGTLLNLIGWWIDNKMPYPPEQMAEIFQQLVMPGLLTTPPTHSGS